MSKDHFLTPDMIDFIVDHHKMHLSLERISVAMQKEFEGTKKFSRSAIKKTLNKLGVETSKEAVRVPVACFVCAKQFTITRSRLRINNGLHNFCSRECFYKWLGENKGLESRKGRHTARKIIQSFIGDVPRGAIIHHVDHNQNNNDIRNLVVFKSQEDHMKFHRDAELVIPLFVGADILLPTSTANRKYNSILVKVIDSLNAWDKISASKDDIERMTLSIATTVRYAMAHLKQHCGPGYVRQALKDAVTNLDDRNALTQLFNDQTTYVISKNI